MPMVFNRPRKLRCLTYLPQCSIEQEDSELERGELNPVVTLLEILIILVGILAGFVLLKNRKK